MSDTQQRQAIANAALNVYAQSETDDDSAQEFKERADGYSIAFAIGLGCTLCIVLAALAAVFWPT